MPSAICVDESADFRIVISAIEVVEPKLFIAVVTTISEGVNSSNLAVGRILRNGANTPRVIGVICYNIGTLVDNTNNVTL
jgi:hypothetical protein